MALAKPFPAAAQVVEAWLDGEGAAFATRLQVKNRGRQQLTWVFAVDHPALADKPVRLTLPKDFPASAARIQVDRARCLVLPHVEEDGNVCLGVVPEPGDYDEPIASIRRSITAFQAFLANCENDAWVKAEFHRERLSYWNRFCGLRRQRSDARPTWKTVYVELQPIDATTQGKVAIYKDDRRALACMKNADPNVLARRHGIASGTFVNGHVLYVALPEGEPWVPGTWPTSLPELDALVARLTSDKYSVQEWFRRMGGKDAQPCLVVLIQGTVLYGYQLFPSPIPLLMDASIEPIELTRIDASWSLARDQQPTAFAARQSKRVLILGCGSLGSPIAELLARAGAGFIDLVDSQLFDPENTGRHVLGLTAAGRSKAVRLAERLTAEVAGCEAKGRIALASSFIADCCAPGMYDLVVDCTGESSVRMLLSRHRRFSLGDCPLVHVWLEPFCAAAHVVFIVPPDTWPMNDPADSLVNAAAWPESTRIALPACSTGFHVYGASDAWQAAGFATERILAALDGKVGSSTIWSWVRSSEFFDALSVGALPRDIVPSKGSPHDVVTLTRKFHDVVAALD